MLRDIDERFDSPTMIRRVKRAFIVVGLCAFALAALSQVDIGTVFHGNEPDQRISYKLGGGKGLINKIRERDKLREAETEQGNGRDLDAERRWGIGAKKTTNTKLAAVGKPLAHANVVVLKDTAFIDEASWPEFEKNITELKWRQSQRNIQKFRDELRAASIDIHGQFVTSNATHREGQQLTTYLSRENVTIPGIFTKYQFKESPFIRKTFKKCSLVGNSGLLINSACGYAIDSADYVFRINVPEMDPYVQDVGYRTNFTTLNPSIFKRKYNYFGSTQLTEKFNTDMSQFQGLLMLPCFSDEAWIPICSRALQRLTPKKALKVAFGDPEQFSLIRDYWATKGLPKYPSTGLYLATAAIELCEQVHLYGFWPFVDSSMPHVTSHPVKYHYFDGIHMVGTHDMRREFALLTRLHRDGVLRIHIEACGAQAEADTVPKSGDPFRAINSKPATTSPRDVPVIDIEKLWENV